MFYLKYIGLATLYSSALALIMIIIDVIAYPALLQGQIQKKLPFSVIIKDLYMEFTTTEKNGKFHAFANRFLNSLASVGYQVAMFIYMIILIIAYSLVGLFFFNIACYFLASFFAVLGIYPIVDFLDCFNVLYEIYGPVIIAFFIYDVVSHHYHRYINERFELKKSGIGDTFHNILRILVFLVPGIIGVVATFMNNAFHDVVYFVAGLVNFTDIYQLFFGYFPEAFLRFSDGRLFVLTTIASLVLLFLFDLSYTKRLSSKANKKILKETRAEMKLKEEIVKGQEVDLNNTKSALEKAKAEKQEMEDKMAKESQAVSEEANTPKATFIDMDEEASEEEGEEITSALKLGQMVGAMKSALDTEDEEEEEESEESSIAYGLGSLVGSVKGKFTGAKDEKQPTAMDSSTPAEEASEEVETEAVSEESSEAEVTEDVSEPERTEDENN